MSTSRFRKLKNVVYNAITTLHTHKSNIRAKKPVDTVELTDTKQLISIIYDRKSGYYTLGLIVCHNKLMDVVQKVNILPFVIVDNIVREYVNDEIILTIDVNISSNSYNYGDEDYDSYIFKLTIGSTSNTNILFSQYNFAYKCKFGYELGSNDHKKYNGLTTYFDSIDESILKYRRSILHNFDKDVSLQTKYCFTNNMRQNVPYAQHASDELHLLFKNCNMNRMHFKHAYTYYNEQNIVEYTIVDYDKYLCFGIIVLCISRGINVIAEKLVKDYQSKDQNLL